MVPKHIQVRKEPAKADKFHGLPQAPILAGSRRIGNQGLFEAGDGLTHQTAQIS